MIDKIETGKGGILRQILVIIIVTAASALPLAGLIYLLGPERCMKTFTVVLSGRLFCSSWNRIHASSALDQPTIGKWYFWFTVFSQLSLPYMAAVRQFCVNQSKLSHWVFAVGLLVLCLFLVCLLTIPFFWLLQYIDAMGFTARRMEGVFYGLGGHLTALGFYVWAVRFPKHAPFDVHFGAAKE